MSEVIWYRLSERAPTEADADERGLVLWHNAVYALVTMQWNSGSPESDWRRLTPADYPPKPREPRRLVRWVHWPEKKTQPWVYICEFDAKEVMRNFGAGGHIQRVDIVEELPEGER